ncbi:MAG: formate dehydrogenase accessory sulfurtransferase FdhD [Cyclobacteriaceae bacterium]
MWDKKFNAVKYSEGIPKTSYEALTREEALQIKINGRSYTITMRTPGNDGILAAGLLFSEGIIKVPDDILKMDEVPSLQDECTLFVDALIKEEVLVGQNIFNRSIASSASCGVCGKIEIGDLDVPVKLTKTSWKLEIGLIPKMLERMRALQDTFEKTGGSHAAALLTIDGNILAVHEDIGRHNAVDKVIGELFLQRRLHCADILLISGRVSYEIVAKCSRAGISFLLAVSAPSSLAVDFCNKSGITLIGFCRDNRATVYTHPENIQQKP